jgi:hypothetical protein
MSSEEKVIGFSGILDAPTGSLAGEKKDMYYRIRDMLLNTLGHSSYYLDRWKENPHHPETRFMFQYFRNLPSPETVGVLGELLSDESPRPKLADDLSNVDAVMTAYPNCDKAIEVLSVLLQNPPTEKGHYNFPTDLAVWQEWYERVKAGKETFRLVGDPVDYTLRGPSKRGAISPGSRGAKRNPASHVEKTESGKLSSGKPGFLPYVVSTIILVAGYLIYRNGKQRRTNA